MGTRKVSLTLPEELIERAERAVATGAARSVSAYVAAAAGAGEVRQSAAEVIGRWQEQNGAPTDEERAAAEARARALTARIDGRRRGAGAA